MTHNTITKGDTTMIQVPITDIDDYDLNGKDYELTVKISTTTQNEWFPIINNEWFAIFTGDKASCLDEFIDETHRMSLAERLECEYRIMPAVNEPTFEELERI
jgi:hypothetical protein